MAERHQVVLQQSASCGSCGGRLRSGDPAYASEVGEGIVCLPCGDEPIVEASPDVETDDAGSLGVPGRSAQREYERRRRRERDAVRQRRGLAIGLVVAAAVATYVAIQVIAAVVNGYIGAHTSGTRHQPFAPSSAHLIGMLLAIVASVGMARSVWMPRQTTTSWSSGAEGERAVGARLTAATSMGVMAVHDRRIPGSRANIDHIAIGPSGVFVIDAKVVKGRVTLRSTGPIWNRGPAKVYVGGRDKTSAIDGMTRQVEAVRGVLRSSGLAESVSVRPVVALVGAEWGWFARPLEVRGVVICWPKEVARIASRPGPLGPETVRSIATAFATQLREA